ncbi:holin-associated N-acetylmuramidase [Nioella ostreopsis]|uniref:holin-associated N-acetylmuramidase n=1 Tax=Nioella ostreopsis TaxID=2448479 RepID=UPI000FDC8F7D|nr:holin-associated N-acetylmuramidase [Nioella ostreopsis]
MLSVRQIASEIVDREGGYVNDPNDPGGATNYGVTIHTMRRLGLDLDGDGDVDEADVRALPRERAVEIFIEHYYFAPRLDRLPEALQPTVFDMQVNAGTNAVRILQRLLRDMGLEIAVDGVIGPQTIAAATAAYDSAGRQMVDAYGIARRNFYYAIGDRRPASRRYATRRDGGKGGWIRRAEEFISPEYHLTEAEHRARVAAWD